MSKSEKTENLIKKPKTMSGFSESHGQEPLLDQPKRSKAFQAGLDAVTGMKGNGKHK